VKRKKRKQIVGVAAVVRDAGGRVLLIRTEKFGWELPGGKVEPGEDLIAALVREVREEAGCDVEVGRLTGITSRLTRPLVTVLTFEARHTAREPRCGGGSLEVRWFSPDAAVAAVTHAVERLRLADALATESGVSYRSYRALDDDDSGDGIPSPRFEFLPQQRI
jgi:8-oxo-dGTP diphosphatase